MTAKNRRIVPIGSRFLGNKEFSMETWCKLQVQSKKDSGEDHRYIYEDELNFSHMAKEMGVSRNTISKHIKNMVTCGVIQKKELNDGTSKKVVYRLQGKFDATKNDFYLLFDVDFLEGLTVGFHKNLLKIYFIYYSYTLRYGSCMLSQSELVKAIGLTDSGKNKYSISLINRTLVDMKLIVCEKETVFEGRKVKTFLKTIAIPYTETDLYKSYKEVAKTKEKSEKNRGGFLLH